MERLRASSELDDSFELALDDYALLRGDADAEYAVTALTAPVFAPDGDVILVLTVVGFAGPMQADALSRYAGRMFEATTAIQRAMTAVEPGITPQRDPAARVRGASA